MNIVEESCGGLEPLQPSLAPPWWLEHPSNVRWIPKLVAPAGFEPTHKESESSVLPGYTKGQWKLLAGDERVERSLSVSKTDLLPLQQSPMKGFQSDHNVFRSCIRGLATSDVLFPYSLHFLGFLSEPVNQVYFTCGWLLTQSPFCTACLYRIEK